jgi:hypothetical protein
MYTTAESIHSKQRSFVRGHRGLTTKAAKATAADQSFTFTTRSWKEMSLDEGNEMVWACTHRPRRKVFLERTYASGATKVIKMCPPPVTTCNGFGFKNGVTMEKDDSDSFFILLGDALLNVKGEACDIHTDCAAGLFCDRSVCQKINSDSCLPERGDEDCLLLGDSLLTKCYMTE